MIAVGFLKELTSFSARASAPALARRSSIGLIVHSKASIWSLRVSMQSRVIGSCANARSWRYETGSNDRGV